MAVVVAVVAASDDGDVTQEAAAAGPLAPPHVANANTNAIPQFHTQIASSAIMTQRTFFDFSAFVAFSLSSADCIVRSSAACSQQQPPRRRRRHTPPITRKPTTRTQAHDDGKSVNGRASAHTYTRTRWMSEAERNGIARCEIGAICDRTQTELTHKHTHTNTNTHN